MAVMQNFLPVTYVAKYFHVKENLVNILKHTSVRSHACGMCSKSFTHTRAALKFIHHLILGLMVVRCVGSSSHSCVV
jgi:hypothetical protein